ncbi:hypothetical protein AWM67_02170 [Riemerella anatipestifer]|nr:hypothetical protein [Riemerella anatipestifer]MSN92364.1 hypothetical protein [Riemerella anatipestifer]OBP48474.1 hypothetical protein AWM67_02170 [Riemerella anatipestifer]OBP62869.1 hypothetical protein AWB84_07115 [Riemerella anatipestifer]OBP65706.1 hypothetical protein AWM62_01000 [Riemerella anatipestifer]
MIEADLESINIQSCINLNNRFLLFSKFIKKRNVKVHCNNKKEQLSIYPINRHFANTMLGVYFIF